MLYGPNGSVVARSSGQPRATRNEETEAKVRAMLKNIDSLLDIVYVAWAGRYALMVKWPEIDPRWKMFQSGEIGDCHDSLGWFCEDMQDPSSLPVAPDSVERLVVERLASCDNTIAPWKDRMKGIIEKNSKVRRDRKMNVVDQAGDIAGTLFEATTRMKANKFEKLLEEVSEGRH